jgi:hypothetical protein
LIAFSPHASAGALGEGRSSPNNTGKWPALTGTVTQARWIPLIHVNDIPFNSLAAADFWLVYKAVRMLLMRGFPP